MRRRRRDQRAWAESLLQCASFPLLGGGGSGGIIDFYDPDHWPFFFERLHFEARVDIASRTWRTRICSIEGKLIGFNASFGIKSLLNQSAGMLGLRCGCGVPQTPQKGSKMGWFGEHACRTSVAESGWDGSRSLIMYVLMRHVEPVG